MNSVYEEKINKALGYIKQNIDQKISLTDIAEAAGFSRFHFHRIFQSYTGDSVYDTIVRFQVERAALVLLSDSSSTIADIAQSAGFEDTASFSRAFRKRFSTSPSAWRKEKNSNAELLITNYPLIKTEKNKAARIKAISTSVKKLEGFSIAYIKHSEAYAGDSALFIYLYNKLTAWAASEDLLGPDRQNIVVYHEPVKITENPKTKISLGISIPEATPINADIGKMKLRGGEYLISRFSLKDDEYSKAWKQIYTQDLPELNLLPADGFCFELYPNDIKSEDKYSSIVDICVPVVNI